VKSHESEGLPFVARLNSVRITVIAIIVVVALALGAWTRLTIAMASGAAASRVSTSSPSTSTPAASKPGRDTKSSKGTTDAKTVKKSTPTTSSSASATTSDASPEQIAQSMLTSYGWDSGQWTYLYQLWQQESQWSVTATNAGSGAYGIAQANPGSQMDSVGSDWRTDATTQIKWGLEYIKDRYGSPEAAWAHETADGWY
jgi:cytoskeletal protein RodZ